MKKFFLVLLAISTHYVSAQDIILSHAQSHSDNKDSRLYRIEDSTSATYLGKIEIQGFLQNEVEAFQKFYKKAKTIGANTYIYSTNTDLDGKPVQNLNKEIRLYYTPNPSEGQNTFSVFNSTKEMKILINGKKVLMPKRSYTTYSIDTKEDNYIATRHFLGSRVNIHYKSNQPKQNYQVISGRLSSDKSGITGGLIFKSGDIILLENSYADFLTIFYNKL